MSNLQFNKTLVMLLENAKKVGEKQSEHASAERFIVAVIDFVACGNFGDDDRDQAKELLTILADNLPFSSEDFADVKKVFLSHINEKPTLSYMDIVYMNLKISKARELALKHQQKELQAQTVLKGIFDDPNEFIKTYLSSRSDRAEKEFEERIDRLILSGNLPNDLEEQSVDVPEPRDCLSEKKTAKADNAKKAIANLTVKVKQINDYISNAVLGQENAVSIFTEGIFQAELLSMTDKERTRPRATFLFAGPPGVGKTFLAEKAAEALELPFMRFDMSEYCDHESSVEFIGSDAVYKDAKQGNFTSFVSKNPKSLILFDEIEKAHISIIHLFLQILDAGRIRDNKTDEEISLSDTILIFTTNAGKQLYEKSETGDFSGVSRKVILKALMSDINPETKHPYFPAAICSRFASGNVVMFNQITAYNLRRIAKREVLRHVCNFEEKIGIKIDIDEQVYSALLFAEGGAVDARTIRSRAESFFNSELYELFRLLSSEKNKSGIEKLTSISVGLELPEDNPEIINLFKYGENLTTLLVASRLTADKCKEEYSQVNYICAQNMPKVKKAMHDNEVSFALIDLSLGRNGKPQYLNLEDVDSTARDIFWYLRENYTDLPIYVLLNKSDELNTEERRSFLRQGVRGFVSISGDTKSYSESLVEITETIHQQRSITALAKANKLITFETAQQIRGKGKKAIITLFDLEMTVAVDSEDSANILSNLTKPDIRFDQVIGAEDAKKELRYFVEYLKNPRKYIGSGVSTPKGIILYGPPGTGKTMLAKAMASESNVTFITAEGNQFLKRFVGEGPEKVHELFKTARKYAPSILFIDEIDAIAKERRGGDATSGSEETLTAFLAEMDGFKKDLSRPVFVLAATNFEMDSGRDKSLDPALLRRFDRRILIDLPKKEERKKYLTMRIAGNDAFDVTEELLDNLVIRSTGMSLAAVESFIELALRMAIRDGNLRVTDKILEEAFETFNSGESKKWDASSLERVARHEAGHAFLYWYYGQTPSYVTIVARANHGGYMQHDDEENKQIITREDLLAKICTSLGGRAAEIVYYGKEGGISTGAGGDLYSATNLATHFVCSYGMDENFGLAVIDPQAAWAGEPSGEVRAAVNNILTKELKKAIDIIEANRESVDELVNRLLSQNHLSGHEIRDAFEKHCHK